MTIQDVFGEFILSRQLADLSPKTVLDYRQFIEPFVQSVSSNLPLDELSQDKITLYISGLLKKPLSKSTRATYIRHLKVFLKWVQDEYPVQYEYKRIKVPKSPKKNVRIYSPDELMEIFSHIIAENDWLTLRNKCIVALMYDSGLRQSEVCSLERSRVSFSEKRMTVCGKGCKERTVPLGNLTASYMKDYLAACPFKSDKVFVNRRGEDLTGNAVKLLISKISSQLPFELSSHKLRHNFATNYCIDQYAEHGQVDIYKLMILLGHEDIETTRRYLHHANEIIGAENCISHLDKLYSGKN